MILTPKTYYTPKNNYLSCSKIKDYLRDPRYFYEKHVLHTRVDEPSIALDIGRAVDLYVSSGPKAFKKAFVCVERRNLKDPPKGKTQLNTSDYSMCVAMGEKVRSQPAFRDLAGYETQRILQVDIPVRPFAGLCGIPDWIKIEGTHCSIVDLKTTNDISQRAYERSCESYGYFLQQSFYQKLAAMMYGCTSFESKHLVIEKDRDGIYACKTFILDQDRIEKEKKYLDQILIQIGQETTWESPQASWDKALLIGRPWTPSNSAWQAPSESRDSTSASESI